MKIHIHNGIIIMKQYNVKRKGYRNAGNDLISMHDIRDSHKFV